MLARARLDGADFAEADLARAEFRDCTLHGADLTEAGPEGAAFPASTLGGEALAGVRWGCTRRFASPAPVPPPAAYASGEAAPAGRCLAWLDGHTAPVPSVCFFPNGALLQLLRAAGTAWACFDGQSRLLCHGGESWRFLHGHDHDAQGRLETWPFEGFRVPDAA